MAEEAETQATRPAPEEVQIPLRQDNVRQMKIALATLAASVVETLSEKDAGFQQRFLARLDKAHENYRNNSDADPQHVLEVIHWTGEMLRGWNPVPGSDKSIFGETPAPTDAASD